MLPNYSLIWWLKCVMVITCDPFQSPSQGDALECGNPIQSPWSPSQSDAPKWGNLISIALVKFARQCTWMGWPHFNHFNHLHKVMHLDGATKFYNQFGSFFNIKMYNISIFAH
jgi:hypothetical protein